jgi:hypothetical protein
MWLQHIQRMLLLLLLLLLRFFKLQPCRRCGSQHGLVQGAACTLVSVTSLSRSGSTATAMSAGAKKSGQALQVPLKAAASNTVMKMRNVARCYVHVLHVVLQMGSNRRGGHH